MRRLKTRRGEERRRKKGEIYRQGRIAVGWIQAQEREVNVAMQVIECCLLTLNWKMRKRRGGKAEVNTVKATHYGAVTSTE